MLYHSRLTLLPNIALNNPETFVALWGNGENSHEA